MHPEFLAFLYGMRAGVTSLVAPVERPIIVAVLDVILDEAESYAEAEAAIEEGRDFEAVDPSIGDRLYEAVRPALDGMVRDTVRYGQGAVMCSCVQGEGEGFGEFQDEAGSPAFDGYDPAALARETARWIVHPEPLVIYGEGSFGSPIVTSDERKMSDVADLWKRATEAQLSQWFDRIVGGPYNEPVNPAPTVEEVRDADRLGVEPEAIKPETIKPAHSVEDAFEASAYDKAKERYAERLGTDAKTAIEAVGGGLNAGTGALLMHGFGMGVSGAGYFEPTATADAAAAERARMQRQDQTAVNFY